jgi:hypothetical protein
MDQDYLKASVSDRFFYNWAVLQLYPHEKDPRIRSAKMLSCNFDYDF